MKVELVSLSTQIAIAKAKGNLTEVMRLFPLAVAKKLELEDGVELSIRMIENTFIVLWLNLAYLI